MERIPGEESRELPPMPRVGQLYRFPRAFGYDFVDLSYATYEPCSTPPQAGEVWQVLKAPAHDQYRRPVSGYVTIRKLYPRGPRHHFFLSARALHHYARRMPAGHWGLLARAPQPVSKVAAEAPAPE